MKKLLVTGASGFLGWYICHQAQVDGWQVYGTHHTQPISVAGVKPIALDLKDLAALRSRLTELQPDAVIHAAALSQPNACQQQPELSEQVNVLATWAIAEHCAAAAIPWVFTSSEQVFDGHQPPYRETDPTHPINLYGEHKLAAETGMRSRYTATPHGLVICRMPLMYGATASPSFIQPFIQRLQSGQPLQVFTDEIRTPVSGADAARGLLLALEIARDQPQRLEASGGILHLGGPERLSRYQMAQILVEVLGLPQAQLQPCLQAEVAMAAPRPRDLSLQSALAQSLGYAPQDFRTALDAIFKT